MQLPTPATMTDALLEVRPLLQALMKPQSQQERFRAMGALTHFLVPGSSEHTFVFCVESWQAGRGVFNAAMKMKITAVRDFPEDARSFVSAIGSLWVQEFRNHPKDASVALYYVETRIRQEDNQVDNLWAAWLREMISKMLGKDINDIVKQHIRIG